MPDTDQSDEVVESRFSRPRAGQGAGEVPEEPRPPGVVVLQVREQADRASSDQRNHPKPKPQHGDGKPTPQAAPATKPNESKPQRPHGGGSAK